MWKRLRKIFAPPVFPEDEEKTRIAGLLNIILWVVVSLVIVFTVPAVIMTPNLQRILVEIFLVLASVGMMALMRRGKIQLTGTILSSVLLIAITLGTYQSGGFRGSTMSAYFGIILIAGMLVGHQAALIFGILSILLTGGMVIADTRGFIPPAPEYANLSTFWTEFSTVVIGVVGLLYLVMTSLHRALARARKGERALALKVIEAEQLAEAAQEASEFKSRLIARVSHELRTPLGAVLGMAEMLMVNAYGPLSDDQEVIMQRIVANSKYLEQNFSELLEQAELQTSHFALRESVFSPGELLDQVDTAFRSQVEQKGLMFLTTLAPDFPASVYGDVRRIEQILVNLVGNAIKFTSAGSVSVDFFQANPAHWVIQVKDTGIGISLEAQDYVFDPFRQEDETIGRRFGGVGLGLSIVQTLVDAMQGEIDMESKTGEGSIFKVKLPLKLAPETEPNEDDQDG